jgi:hypothetical protein
VSEDEWVSDDSSVDKDEFIYRRVSKNDKGSFTLDRKSGTKCLGKGAFTLNPNDKADPAGCSVHMDSLLRAHEIPTSKLADWDKQGVGRFQAVDVRRGEGGVVLSPDEEDEALGKAHALLRTKTAGLPKAEWSDVRDAILEEAIYFESDPGYVAPLSDIQSCEARQPIVADRSETNDLADAEGRSTVADEPEVADRPAAIDQPVVANQQIGKSKPVLRRAISAVICLAAITAVLRASRQHQAARRRPGARRHTPIRFCRER